MVWFTNLSQELKKGYFDIHSVKQIIFKKPSVHRLKISCDQEKRCMELQTQDKMVVTKNGSLEETYNMSLDLPFTFTSVFI